MYDVFSLGFSHHGLKSKPLSSYSQMGILLAFGYVDNGYSSSTEFPGQPSTSFVRVKLQAQ